MVEIHHEFLRKIVAKIFGTNSLLRLQDMLLLLLLTRCLETLPRERITKEIENYIF